MIWTRKAFLSLGLEISWRLRVEKPNLTAENGFFKTTYGVTPDVCAHTWEYMSRYNTMPNNSRPKHLLWTLIFLNLYEPETFLAALFGPTEKTFRKWVRIIIESINQLFDRVVSNKTRLQINCFNHY